MYTVVIIVRYILPTIRYTYLFFLFIYNLKTTKMNTTSKMKVSNLESNKGNKIANQFEVTTNEGRYFQSYESVIVFIPNDGKIQIDSKYWDYSMTTGKYRNIFLGEDKKETQRKINDGTYILTNLN